MYFVCSKQKKTCSSAGNYPARFKIRFLACFSVSETPINPFGPCTIH